MGYKALDKKDEGMMMLNPDIDFLCVCSNNTDTSVDVFVCV